MTPRIAGALGRAGRLSTLFIRGVACGVFAGAIAITCATAEVVRLEVVGRSDIASDEYEQVVGRLHFEIDPAHPRNRIIADVGLAPTNAVGRVCFSADVRVRKPKASRPDCHAAWVEIPNRGGKSGLSRLMVRHGFTVMEIGWEFDVPAGGDKMRIELPVARQKDGGPVRGIVRATFTPDKRGDEFTLSDLAEYPPVDADGADGTLIIRATTPFPGGDLIRRERWWLAGQRVTLEGGFETGKTYELGYLSEDPPIAGLGLAAIRDAVAWLKHGPDSAAAVAHAYAFGSSQCGRLLREFIYLGFNTDEAGRAVLDGVMAHVAGAGRLDINRRWSVPRAVAAFATASYPFADTAHPDPITAISEGVQDNDRVTHKPKTFYTNTAAEYWGAGRVAALTHTTPDGTRDVPLPDQVRSYFFAGTQHGPAGFPPTAIAKDGPFANPVSAAPVLVALRLAMHRWVSEGVQPPESAYPRLESGTLVPVADVQFPELPGIPSPRRARAGARLHNPLWPDGAGAGKELPLLVPQVDRDGNDVAGIRMPDVNVPLATCTGWVFRPASMGAPEELMPLKGSWIPFPISRQERERRRDPRAAIEERYPARETYMARVDDALKLLCKQGFLLGEDVAPLRAQAASRWDWLVSLSHAGVRSDAFRRWDGPASRGADNPVCHRRVAHGG